MPSGGDSPRGRPPRRSTCAGSAPASSPGFTGGGPDRRLHLYRPRGRDDLRRPAGARRSRHRRRRRMGERRAVERRPQGRPARSVPRSIASAKQSFKAPMTIRNGDREAIKVRHFVRVATNLSLIDRHLRHRHPAIQPPAASSPRRMDERVGRAGARKSPTPTSRSSGATCRSLAVEAQRAGPDRRRRRSPSSRRSAGSSARPDAATAVPIPAQQMLSRTLRQPDALGDALGYARIVDAPFSTIEVRVVPENVTELAKDRAARRRAARRGARPHPQEGRDRSRRSCAAYGATPDQIRGHLDGARGPDQGRGLPEGQRMRILIAPGPRPGRSAGRSCASSSSASAASRASRPRTTAAFSCR